MLSKQNYMTMYIVIILLIASYLCYLQTNYLKETSQETNFFDDLSSLLMFGIGAVTVIGFIMYFNRQYNEHKDDFDMMKFIFGTNQCDKLKTL
jgi:hypothetical protein